MLVAVVVHAGCLCSIHDIGFAALSACLEVTILTFDWFVFQFVVLLCADDAEVVCLVCCHVVVVVVVVVVVQIYSSYFGYVLM